MDRQKINLISATACILMSFQAFALVLLVLVTGWDRHLKDEGAAAHIFQLLLACQLPFVAAFLATARWRQPGAIARPLALEAAGLALAFGAIAIFKL